MKTCSRERTFAGSLSASADAALGLGPVGPAKTPQKACSLAPVKRFQTCSSAGLVLCAILLPRFAMAQVVISEFLYDAPGSDTGGEWVELFNAGASAVDLTKWKINDGSNHILNVPPKNGSKGSITINPGSYTVLAADAATFITQYPDVANVIDTTLALPNTSGAVSLVDESGATVDSLAYSKEQGAAGDGNTLQRVALGGTSLDPAPPTPGTGALAVSGSAESGSADSNASPTTTPGEAQTTTSGSSASVSSYVPPPVPQIFADGGEDRIAIVGADVEFSGRAYNRDRAIVDKVRFLWNFGDGSTAEGESVLHHFDYPGRYAVSLDIAHDRNAASDLIVVSAEPARLAFSALPDGSVAIENGAGRNLDLSHWLVQNVSRTFMLPDRSIVLSGTTFHISQKTLGFWSSASTELAYPNGVVALRSGERTPESQAAPASSAPPPPPTHASSSTSLAARVELAPASRGSVEEHSPSRDIDPSAATDTAVENPTSSQEASASAAAPRSPFWWFVALGLAGLSALALALMRYFRKGEWDIEEG